MPTMEPAHPGGVFLRAWLRPMGVSVSAAAKALGVSRYRLAEITKERAPVTPEIAIRIEKAFGGTARGWCQMQLNHDLWHAESSSQSIRVTPVGRAA